MPSSRTFPDKASEPIRIIRKRVKHLYLRVRSSEGPVEITAPMRYPEGKIAALVEERRDWIREQRKRRRMEEQRESVFEQGKTIWVFGRPYTVRILSVPGGGTPYAEGQTYVFPVGGEITEKKLSRLWDSFRKESLSSKLETLIDRWQKKTGWQASGYKIISMRTRWGSCNIRTRELHFSLMLFHQPEEFLEYVVLHELTHLKEAGHGRAFWNRIAPYMPDWKKRKQIPRQYLK